MAEPTRIPERQLELGAAGFFRVLPEDPAGNQVVVRAGFVYAPGYSITGGVAEQTTAAFAPVGGGQQRYDLVYLDGSGVATILQGTAVAAGSPAYDGAPAQTGGPGLPDRAIPIAYVFVDETGAVEVTTADITQLGGHYQVSRDFDGYLVDKGLFGAAPAGTSDDVSALFAGDAQGGSVAVRGVVTDPPFNYVTLLDEYGDEIIHTTGARCFGRLTWAASVWTLSYYYIDALGVETAMDPSTDATRVPADVRLVGVPVVYSRNDVTRPLFPSSVARLSDQLVGDIPYASETAPGKVEFAPNLGTAALEAVQASDTRLGRVKGSKRAAVSGVSIGTGSLSNLLGDIAFVQGTGITITVYEDAGNNRLVVEVVNSLPAVAVNLTAAHTLWAAAAAPFDITLPTKQPRLAWYFGTTAVGGGARASVGLALGATAADQSNTNNAGALVATNNGYVMGIDATILWRATTWSTTLVRVTLAVGGGIGETFSGIGAVLADP